MSLTETCFYSRLYGKPFFSDDRFLDSLYKSFLNQTTLDLRKEKWSFFHNFHFKINLFLKSKSMIFFQVYLHWPKLSKIFSIHFSWSVEHWLHNHKQFFIEFCWPDEIFTRLLSRFEFQVPHQILKSALATDQKWPLSHFRISYQSLTDCHYL